MKKLTALLAIAVIFFAFSALAEDSGLRLMEAKQIEGTQDMRFYISTNTPPVAEDLTVYMDGAPVDAPLSLQSASEAEVGVVYVFCVDISGSISGNDINKAKAYLVDFCDKLGVNDLMRVYTIGDTASPLTGYTRDRAEVEKALNGITVRSSKTFLWESIKMAARDLRKNSETLPKLSQLIVFSDGVEDSEGAGCSVDDALKRVNKAGAPLRVVLMNSTETNDVKLQAGMEGINYLCNKSGGVLIEPANGDFSAGLEELGTIISNDYCLTADRLTYESLTGEKEWYVEQRLPDGSVVRSNTMNCALSQEGLARPVRNLTIYVNDEQYTGGVLAVDQNEGTTVKVSADGDVTGYSAVLSSGDLELGQRTFNDSCDMSGLMRYGEDYALTVEAIPLSNESGQTLTATASLTLKALPVKNIGITVNGQDAADGTVAVEQNSSVRFEWSVDGDVRDYDVVLSEDGGAIDSLNTTDTGYTCFCAGWELGKTYLLSVTANSYSDEPDQTLDVSAQAVLLPIDVSALEIDIEDAEKTDDGVFLLTRNAVSKINTVSDGDIKSCSYDLDGSDLAAEIDAATLELGKTYTLTANAEPWSANEGQITTASAIVALKPDEITDFGLTVDGEEAGDDVLYIDRETGLDAEVIVQGDVAGVTVTAPEQIGVTQDSGSLHLTSESAVVGDVYDLNLTAAPYGYGTVAENVDVNRTYSVAVKPLPVSSISLYVDGTDGDINGGEAKVTGDAVISWAVDGDAREYVVTLPDGSTETITDTSYTISNTVLSPTDAYGFKVEAVPYDGEIVSVSVDILRSGIALSNARMYLDGELIDLEHPKAELGEDPVELRVEVDGEAKDAVFSFVNKLGEIKTLESEGFAVSVSSECMENEITGEIRAELIPIDQSNGTVTLSLPVTKKKGLDWSFIAAMAAAGALLAALLITLLVKHGRKKEEEQPNPPDTGNGEGTIRTPWSAAESDRQVSKAVEIRYRQEVEGEETVTVTHIVRGKALIGRDRESDIFFNGGSRWEQTISRRHALLTVDDDFRLFIEPVAAMNEIKVDGAVIKDHMELNAGAVVEMGDVRWIITGVERI